ncbi:hypothetical protein Catovirus_1_257 [Catovirus CTV1]|uniref:Uncharacterized protein n=1 Tax=Catovirus CTV1 TaxID=1977631 RepID=A0A1V0S922_9VIRU|nr:hypothetical protein Catovirus_1_257 [Catovirus CTV1]
MTILIITVEDTKFELEISNIMYNNFVPIIGYNFNGCIESTYPDNSSEIFKNVIIPIVTNNVTDKFYDYITINNISYINSELNFFGLDELCQNSTNKTFNNINNIVIKKLMHNLKAKLYNNTNNFVVNYLHGIENDSLEPTNEIELKYPYYDIDNIDCNFYGRFSSTDTYTMLDERLLYDLSKILTLQKLLNVIKMLNISISTTNFLILKNIINCVKIITIII